MAEAVVVTSRQKLADALAEWPDSRADTTWAMVCLSVVPSAGELDALREAARICDRVVAVRLTPDRVAPPKLAATVRAAGADVLYLPREVNGRVMVRVEGEKADEATVTLLVQALLAVMPMVVLVPRGDAAVVRLLRAVQGGLGDFFSLRII